MVVVRDFELGHVARLALDAAAAEGGEDLADHVLLPGHARGADGRYGIPWDTVCQLWETKRKLNLGYKCDLCHRKQRGNGSIPATGHMDKTIVSRSGERLAQGIVDEVEFGQDLTEFGQISVRQFG